LCAPSVVGREKKKQGIYCRFAPFAVQSRVPSKLLSPSAVIFLIKLDPSLEQIATIAKMAGRRVLEMSTQDLKKFRKKDHSLVTEADLEADRMIRAFLMEAFPEDSILTEEVGYCVSTPNNRVWVVDPLDGTRAFAKGKPGYCVMIGLLVEGLPKMGVVYDPERGVTRGGASEKGCFLWPQDGPPQRLQPPEVPETPRFITTPSVDATLLEGMLTELNMVAAPSMHSVGLKVAEVIRGASHVYFSHHPLSYWDTVAPVAMALECGAVCTLADGTALNYTPSTEGPWSHPQPLVVTRGVDHNHVIETLQQLMDR